MEFTRQLEAFPTVLNMVEPLSSLLSKVGIILRLFEFAGPFMMKFVAVVGMLVEIWPGMILGEIPW